MGRIIADGLSEKAKAEIEELITDKPLTGSGFTVSAGPRVIGRQSGAGEPEEINPTNLRNAFELAKSGPVAETGITMSTARILGRNAAGVGPTQELTALQVRTLTQTLQSGPIITSGATMATSRVLGRTTGGAGALEELTAEQLQSFLGISTGTGSVTEGGVTFVWSAIKIGSSVSLGIRLNGSSSSVSSGDVTAPALIPSGFRPSTNQRCIARYTGGDQDPVSVRIATSGNVVIEGMLPGSSGLSLANEAVSAAYST
jgi:hypothetical protein